METLLTVSIIVIALAIVAQAGVLIALYLISSRVAKNAESLMNENRRLLIPLEPVVHNAKVVTNDLTEISKTARSQVERVAALVSDGSEALRAQAADVKSTIMSPIRYTGAAVAGVRESLRVLLGGKMRPEDDNDLRRYRDAS